MNIPVWLMWVVAITLASMPLSILLMRRSEKDGVDGSSDLVREELIDVTECLSDTEILVLTTLVARIQMRQYWPVEYSPYID